MSAEAPRVEKTLTYRFLRRISWIGFRTWFPARIEGREHLPASGPVVLASNHQSYLDIPLLSIATRRHVCFVARESLARSSLLAWIMEQCGAVLVKRGESDRGAVRDMLAHLERGDCVAIFPEGTRSPDGRVGDFRRGALLVARKARAPIVPVAIAGTIDALPRSGGPSGPRRVGIRLGAPIDAGLPDAQERVRQAVLDMAGDGRYRSWSATGHPGAV